MKKSIAIIFFLSMFLSAMSQTRILVPHKKESFEVILTCTAKDAKEWAMYSTAKFKIISCSVDSITEKNKSEYVQVYKIKSMESGIHQATFKSINPCTGEVKTCNLMVITKWKKPTRKEF